MLSYSMLLLACFMLPYLATARCIMYLTGQHNVVPAPHLISDITHVALAFMQSSKFITPEPATSWPLFTTVEEVRSKFAKGTIVMIAIGGWGDTAGFDAAAQTNETRQRFARNVKAMVEDTRADGVDIDWEYPGGNGEDYKKVPNSAKAWEIAAYPLLLSAIRSALGPSKIISAAVPARPEDRSLAFTKDHLPAISESVDFLNIMTYDMMNRRDAVVKHHTGIQLSLDAIDGYLANGLENEKANLGFAFYIKWFKTDPHDRACFKLLGGGGGGKVQCKTVLMEDPDTGADLGQAGGFSWHDEVPADREDSFGKAMVSGRYDAVGGGWYYWDADEDLWWTWDTPEMIKKKFPAIVEKRGLGGVFAWGLGEDATSWTHLKALTAGVRESKSKRVEL